MRRDGGALPARRAAAGVGEASDARHIAVEFVHPVIVGKRALPALAIPPEALELERARRHRRRLQRAWGGDRREVVQPADGRPVRPPGADRDALPRALGARARVLRAPGALACGRRCGGFLYPFLDGGSADLDAVRRGRAALDRGQGVEIGALREQTLVENESVRQAAAARWRAGARSGQRRLGDRRDGRRRRLPGPRPASAGSDRRPGGLDRDRQRHRRRGDLLAPGDRPRPARGHAV